MTAMFPGTRLRIVPMPAAEPTPTAPVRPTEFGGGSRASMALAAALRSTVRPFISVWATVPLLPWPYAVVDYAGLLLHTAEDTTYERHRFDGFHVEVLRTPSVEDRVVLYLHGGAFVVGGRYLHRGLMSNIAERTRAAVHAVEYRQLPDHPVRVSIADCVAAYRHLVETGVDPARIVIMGDSAGGYLTFQTALAARDEGLPLPAGLVAMSPLIDFDGTAKVAAPGAATCAVFPRNCFDGLAKVVRRAAHRNGEAARLPSAPTSAQLGELPPTLIQASRDEIVYPDAVSMAESLAAAGVDVELQVWDGQVHVFQAAAGLVPEAAEALDEIETFVDQVVPDRPRVVAAR